MRIFLSYASGDKAVAEPIAFSLRSRGHSVFLDKDDLPPGRSYDDQIEKAVGQSDVMVFLISPDSISRGRFTLTELEFARAAWRTPANRVLPVMVKPTALADVPNFLKGVTILEPQGNIAAEVAAAVDDLVKIPSAWALAPWLALACAASGALSGLLAILTPDAWFYNSPLNLTLYGLTLHNIKFAPIYVPLIFTAALLLALRKLTPLQLGRWPLMLLLVVVGWTAAVNIGTKFSSVFEGGIDISKLGAADEIDAAKAELLEKIKTQNQSMSAIGAYVVGFFAGIVGAAFTWAGFRAALTGPVRNFSTADVIILILVAGVAGTAFFHVSMNNFDLAFAPVFVAWQTAVGLMTAIAIKNSRA